MLPALIRKGDFPMKHGSAHPGGAICSRCFWLQMPAWEVAYGPGGSPHRSNTRGAELLAPAPFSFQAKDENGKAARPEQAPPNKLSAAEHLYAKPGAGQRATLRPFLQDANVLKNNVTVPQTRARRKIQALACPAADFTFPPIGPRG